jgi:hypothetical protein
LVGFIRADCTGDEDIELVLFGRCLTFIVVVVFFSYLTIDRLRSVENLGEVPLGDIDRRSFTGPVE